ncbi:hypothetical protein [Mycolicibacterium hodleri]|uniref:Uncharacterized protein n=1 Tax=Mycolicibacterium hodleri TaxID=49897 RepID=A0A502ECH6_9MYCO|nr:hypothetical protein [Mycolicibacterium hodleri]TPG34170.1 hypothetical protein EAH80_11200 [Mycolicibacterium hodleri]
MNTAPRKSKLRNRWTTDHDTAVQQLAAAVQQVRESDTPAAQEQLRSAVDAARQVGVGWTRIGDTLGIASGNAYQRYRMRPRPSQARQSSYTGHDGE